MVDQGPDPCRQMAAGGIHRIKRDRIGFLFFEKHLQPAVPQKRQRGVMRATGNAQAMAAGDFYILCPDNDVTPERDQRRVAWALGDILENRPALSRWHPDYADAFAGFEKS